MTLFDFLQLTTLIGGKLLEAIYVRCKIEAKWGTHVASYSNTRSCEECCTVPLHTTNHARGTSHRYGTHTSHLYSQNCIDKIAYAHKRLN